MATRYIASLVLAASLAAAPAWAADASGTWRGEVKLATGQSVPFTAHLVQNKSEISGTLEGINGAPDVLIMDGKIAGDIITFWGVRKVNGAELKFRYTGTLMGDSLDFKIARDDGTGTPLETMTRRAKEDH